MWLWTGWLTFQRLSMVDTVPSTPGAVGRVEDIGHGDTLGLACDHSSTNPAWMWLCIPPIWCPVQGWGLDWAGLGCELVGDHSTGLLTKLQIP